MSDTLLQNMVSVLLADQAFKSLVDDRLFPDHADFDKVTLPYVVYLDVSLVTDQTLAGPNGMRDGRIQFDAYAQTKATAHAIRERILSLFNGYQGQLDGGVNVLCAEFTNQRSDYDPDEKIYSYSTDITFSYIID